VNVVGLFKNKVVILDKDDSHNILKVGESTSMGLKLIAANSRGAIFQDKLGTLIKIGLNNEINSSINYHKTSGAEFIMLDEQNRYLTDIFINNTQPSIKAIIDTGAGYVTINGDTANSLGIDYKKIGKPINVSTASEKILGYIVTLESVQLGSIKLTNIETIILEGNQPELALIGMNFLKNLDLQYNDNKLELTINKD
jgi:aspartyl protease family protein